MLSVEVMRCRVVLEMLDRAVVSASGHSVHGSSDGDGSVVRMCVLHQKTCPLTVCYIPQCSNDSFIQLHWNRGVSV